VYPAYADNEPLATGGEDHTQLTLESLPSVYRFARDDVRWAVGDNTDWHNIHGSMPAMQETNYEDRRRGWDKGGGSRLDNRPPYIALYYCLKQE